MVYGIIQLINFAHGEIFMVGAYGRPGHRAPSCSRRRSRRPVVVPLPLMLVGGIVVAVVIAVLMERFAYRPLRNAPRLAPLITALGVSVALQEAVRVFYPNATAAMPFPKVFLEGALVHRSVTVVDLVRPACSSSSSRWGSAIMLRLYINQLPHGPGDARHLPGPATPRG